MRPTQFERCEIEINFWFQFLAVPIVNAKKLFVIFATFIPVGQQRTGEVKPFAVPTLRNHVKLTPDFFLINLVGMVRVRHVEYAALPIAETVREQRLVISAEADVRR